MPGLPIGNYYGSLDNKYAYFYAAHCVNENPVISYQIGNSYAPYANLSSMFFSGALDMTL